MEIAVVVDAVVAVLVVAAIVAAVTFDGALNEVVPHHVKLVQIFEEIVNEIMM